MLVKFPGIFLLLLFACNNNSAPKVRNTDAIQVKSVTDTVQENLERLPTEQLLSFSELSSHRSDIDILSIDKYTDSTSQHFNRNKNQCSIWNLAKKEAKMILITSESIVSQEFHYYYDVYPCYYTGEIIFKGKSAKYRINAGAFSVIEFKDTSIYLGYKKADYKKYFLLGPGID